MHLYEGGDFLTAHNFQWETQDSCALNADNEKDASCKGDHAPNVRDGQC